VKLNYKIYGEGFPLIILHGVFGSGDNWTTLAKHFSKEFKTILPDLRNHGRSPHSSLFNYQVMSEDLLELVDDLGISRFHLVGHSMGGKVSMFFANKFPEMIEKLVVVDIAPRYYKPHHQQILAGFRSVDLGQIESRQEAEDSMAAEIIEPDVRQFLLKNLFRNEEGAFGWRVNLNAIEAQIEEVGKVFSIENQLDVPTLFIKGGRSKYIQDKDKEDIENLFSNVIIKTIEEAGHWVHSEQPEATYQLIAAFLKS